jgi:glycosyltransferase involved in cell wall biosynthesis
MVSVIIPSLGGDLSKTLDSLNSGALTPDEIIICLPNKKHLVNNLLNYTNVSIIYSEIYGQVYQRIFGFKSAKGDYVLQIDDDVVVSFDCLQELMLSMLNVKRKVSVSPCWFNLDNNKPLHQHKKNSVLMSLYYWILNGPKGFKPGEISLSGANFGINPKDIHSKIISVDWQPGGCVLHNKKNILLENYYPYKGKAYSEDLIHSYLLRKSGVSLILNMEAICMTHTNPRLNLSSEIISDFKAKRYFVKLANLSLLRMVAYYAIYIVRAL